MSSAAASGPSLRALRETAREAFTPRGPPPRSLSPGPGRGLRPHRRARRPGPARSGTEIPQWRCLLVRTWLENGEPDYHVVADGHWLVFDVSLYVLYTPTDEEFSGEFEPAAPRPRPGGGRAETPQGDPDWPRIRSARQARERVTGVATSDRHAGHRHALSQDFRRLTVQRRARLAVVVGSSLLAGLVRAVAVVMAGLLAQHRSQMPFAVDEHPVGALCSCGAYPSLGITVRARGPRRSLHYGHALVGEDRVEGTGELGVAVPDEEANCEIRSPRSISRLRACRAVHAPSGWAVTPRTCTGRVSTSMTNSTYRRLRKIVSTWKKPHASSPSA